MSPLTFSKAVKWTLVGCSVIVVFLVISALKEIAPRQAGEAAPVPKEEFYPEDYAITMSWEYVKSSLKYPSTAKFAKISEHKEYRIQGRENAFEVHGHVDSQNGFGETTRIFFICRLEYVGNDSWELIDLDIY